MGMRGKDGSLWALVSGGEVAGGRDRGVGSGGGAELAVKRALDEQTGMESATFLKIN